MGKKRMWLVTIVHTEVFPIQIEANTTEEAHKLAIQMYEGDSDLEPVESYYFIKDVLKEN